MQLASGYPGRHRVILVVGMLLITLIIAQVVSRTHPVLALAGAIGSGKPNGSLLEAAQIHPPNR